MKNGPLLKGTNRLGLYNILTNVLDKALNHRMVRLQQYRNFGKCGVNPSLLLLSGPL